MQEPEDRSPIPEEKLSGDDQSKKTMVEIGASYSGPLPLPQQLQGYEEIVPGAADRIIRMAEKQSAHRIEIESKVI
jgi:uncharacterized membrane protein